MDAHTIGGYDSGEGWGWAGGQIIGLSNGVIRCRMCHRFEVMPVYVARCGSRVHYFGLHHTCARVYWARRKVNDLTRLIDDVDLVCVVLTAQGREVFSLH